MHKLLFGHSWTVVRAWLISIGSYAIGLTVFCLGAWVIGCMGGEEHDRKWEEADIFELVYFGLWAYLLLLLIFDMARHTYQFRQKVKPLTGRGFMSSPNLVGFWTMAFFASLLFVAMCGVAYAIAKFRFLLVDTVPFCPMSEQLTKVIEFGPTLVQLVLIGFSLVDYLVFLRAARNITR